MADITLAEFNGRVWLVGGEDHIDALLANTLSHDVSIELVACERKSDVHDLWVQNSGAHPEAMDPWLIHPGIVARIRRNTPGYAIFFAQWSALIDDEAATVIASAAAWARDNPEMPVLVTEYLAADGPAPIADLSRLRAQLIEERLVGLGLARERIGRSRKSVSEIPGMGEESQRVDIVVRAG